MNPSGVGARPKRHEELGGGSTVTTREDIEMPLAKIHVLEGQYDEVQSTPSRTGSSGPWGPAPSSSPTAACC